MFYIRDESGALDLAVGYDGMRNLFEYGGDPTKYVDDLSAKKFDFRGILRLRDWEELIIAVCQRIGWDADLAMKRIHQGLAAEREVNNFLDELKEAANPIYYNYWRVMWPLDEMLAEIAAFRNAKAARAAKKHHTKRRRAAFNSRRDILVLRLLDAGRPYICAVDGCEVNVNLTVDHVTALSRGGSDDLVNLQFLCGPHNSEKGDRDWHPSGAGGP